MLELSPSLSQIVDQRPYFEITCAQAGLDGICVHGPDARVAVAHAID
jgi:hypothetical protein